MSAEWHCIAHGFRRAAFLVTLIYLYGCQRWRPVTTPLPISGPTTLRVVTRPQATGTAQRFTLHQARVSGDSIVGILAQEHRRAEGGGWTIVRQSERGRRVAIATADVAVVDRPEFSPGRTTALVLGGGAVLFAAFIILGYLTYSGKF